MCKSLMERSWDFGFWPSIAPKLEPRVYRNAALVKFEIGGSKRVRHIEDPTEVLCGQPVHSTHTMNTAVWRTEQEL